MNGGERNSLLTKETKPAVSCANDGSTKLTAFQSMMCSQGTKLSSSFPALVENIAMAGNKLLVLQAKPIPSPGDMYLASHYELSLATVFPKRDEIFSMGQADTNKLWDASFQPVAKDEVVIFASYWKLFSLKTRNWLPEIAPRNANRHSVYSPNGEYYLAVEPSREEPSQFTLYRTADGMKLFTSPKMAHVFEVTWSPDSRRFAVVTVPKELSAMAYREVLTIYSLP
jgi:hypothetical protein